MQENIYCGCDPGSDGFFVVINDNGELVTSLRMPHYPTSGINPKEVHAFLNNLKSLYGERLHVALEEIHAVRGASAGSTFTFGRNYEAVLSCLKILSLNFILVPPSEWQPIAWEGIEKVYTQLPSGRKKHETKKTSLLASQALFPSIDIRISTRAKSPHDGKVDALLIADFLRRKVKGQWLKK